jgi:predicted SAM-dependent methyltransferase
MNHVINDAGRHLEETDPRPEFLLMEKYIRGLGLDFGCGCNRLSPTVLSVDRHKEPGVDMVWNIVHDGGRYPLLFSDNTFDFVFTSHVLEDFELDEVQFAFDELLRIIKPNGYLITIGPDMQNNRYPKWDAVFTAESPEVIKWRKKGWRTGWQSFTQV